MSRIKHIVWITPGFASDESDTQCIPPIQLLAKSLAQESSIHLRIIALHYPYKSTPFEWNGVMVYPCYAAGLASRLRIWVKVRRTVVTLHHEFPIDGIHSFWMTDAALLGHWLSKHLSVPHWVTLMGQDARKSNRYLRFMPTSRMHTIALSDFHAHTWKQTVGNKPNQIIPWGGRKGYSIFGSR